MFKKKLVSVIIVNYNGKEFIKETIDSVLKSNYPKIEIIIVDNASKDSSFFYLKKIYSKEKRIKIFRLSKQAYFAGGSNFGAAKAKGEILFFLNSDAVVDKNCIKNLIKFHQKHPKDLIQPKILKYYQKNIIDNAGGKYTSWGFGFGINRNQKDTAGKIKRAVDFVNGTAFIINKKLFFFLGKFDEWFKHHYEDVDLCLRAKKYGSRCWCFEKAIVYHKGSLTFKKNVKNNQFLFHIRKNRIKVILKNFRGFRKLTKLLIVLSFYFLLSIADLVTFKKERSFLTVKAVWAAFFLK